MRDVSDWVRGEKDMEAQMELVRRNLTKERRKKSGVKAMRLTKFPQFDISYVVPQSSKEEESKSSLIMRFARSLVLGALDNLIMIQETENRKLRG